MALCDGRIRNQDIARQCKCDACKRWWVANVPGYRLCRKCNDVFLACDEYEGMCEQCFDSEPDDTIVPNDPLVSVHFAPGFAKDFVTNLYASSAAKDKKRREEWLIAVVSKYVPYDQVAHLVQQLLSMQDMASQGICTTCKIGTSKLLSEIIPGGVYGLMGPVCAKCQDLVLAAAKRAKFIQIVYPHKVVIIRPEDEGTCPFCGDRLLQRWLGGRGWVTFCNQCGKEQ